VGVEALANRKLRSATMAGKGSKKDDDDGGMGESTSLFSSLSLHGKSLKSSQPFILKMEWQCRSGLPHVSTARVMARTTREN
jgi:hypothetical protein